MNHKFKPGDKVIVKKLSEKEFEEVYNKKHNHPWTYEEYPKHCKNFFGKTFTIREIAKNGNCWIKETYGWFFEEEFESMYSIKEKIEFIKEILIN